MSPTRSTIILFLLLVALCARHLAAQVLVTATAPTPMSAKATGSGVTAADSLPAGSVGSVVWLSAFQYPALSLFTQVLTTTDSAVTLDLTMLAQLDGTLGPPVGSASCGPNILDLQLSTAQPTQVQLAVDFLNLSDPGAPTPGFTIDIGNDGFVENTNGQWGHLSSAILFLDSQPITIRVTSWADVFAQGSSRARSTLEVKPSHTVVSPPLVAGCGISINVLPTFTATGIDVFAGNSGWPSIVVFGFAPQPILLPPSLGQPCLLYPRPDVLMLATPSVPLSIPLPASIRPFQVWVQAVGITAAGLQSSAAHQLVGW